jgi:hypothetical protein
MRVNPSAQRLGKGNTGFLPDFVAHWIAVHPAASDRDAKA